MRKRNRVGSPLSLRIYRAHQVLQAQLQEEAAERMRAGGTLAKFRQGPGRTMDQIGELFEVSGRTVEKVVAVYQAAEVEPDRYGRCVEEMERADKIDGAFKRLRRLQDEARVLRLVPVAGRFRTLVLDPPWDTDGMSDVAGPDYALMSLDAIAALPVPAWAEDEAHIYLWVTNNAILEGGKLLSFWGFEYKTVQTWRKPHFGNGHYFRNTTEHFLFGVKGGLMTRPAAQSVRSDHDWPVGDHSEKPEGFYDLVRACSFPPYGEAFQRAPRPDFQNLFESQAARMEAAE